ncbi:MAG: hypothetical protein HRT47_07740 [Candidatus Caenarcaniphilales bacterium]|nr:hypothetical protein [Candidatus Caenarcaniphilales bacterium]
MAIFTILGNINTLNEFEMEEILDCDLDSAYFDHEIKNQGNKIKQLFCERESCEAEMNSMFTIK